MLVDLPPVYEKPPVEHHCFIDHQAVATKQLATLSNEELDADWKLGEFFGTIFVINFPQEIERLKLLKEANQEIGLQEFEIFPAIDGRKEVSDTLWKKMDRNWAQIDLSTPEGQEAFDRQRQGETGCYLSHLSVIKKVKACFEQAKEDLARLQSTHASPEAISEAMKRLRKSSSVLILEDDNAFGIVSQDKLSASLKGVGRLFRKAMQELPQTWDMIYFMALSRDPVEPFSPHLVKLSRAILMNAYALNHTLYDKAISQLEKIADPKILRVDPVDNEVAQLHRLAHCYAIRPSIAYQRDGESSIIGVKRRTFRQTQPD